MIPGESGSGLRWIREGLRVRCARTVNIPQLNASNSTSRLVLLFARYNWCLAKIRSAPFLSNAYQRFEALFAGDF